VTVSIITPAHFNHDELLVAIESLNAQSTNDWQHVIVHDGPNPEMRERLVAWGYGPFGKRVFVELGRNWHGFMGGDACRTPPGPGARGGRGSRSAEVCNFATHLATGEYIGYLDADCEFRSRHVEVSQAALVSTGADFSYTQVERLIDGNRWDIIGNGAPCHGTIDGNGVVHKAELLKTANWRWGGDADWDLFGRWLKGGAQCLFIPMTTVTWKHAADDI
jgi:hypothetical protein